MKEITINTQNDMLTASSLEVAVNFEKQHKNVIQAIENLAAENSATKNMFIESTYMNRGKAYKYYEITRDGFCLLAMGFTGKKALEWKLKYIEAFNLMEEQLHTNYTNLDEIISRTVTQTIAALMPLLQNQQSTEKTIIVNNVPSVRKRIRNRKHALQPLKVETLPPELKQQVDTMIIAGEYSQQQIANFITNHGISISQMAVSKYIRKYFTE